METTLSTETAKCHILNMPPEMRNRIYELVFDRSTNKTLNLLEAKPPEKAILLTCRIIRAEAKQMYEVERRRFWSDTRFVLRLSTDSELQRDQACNTIHRLSDEALDHLHLTIKLGRPSKSAATVYYVREVQMWRLGSVSGRCVIWYDYFRMVPKSLESRLKAARVRTDSFQANDALLWAHMNDFSPGPVLEEQKRVAQATLSFRGQLEAAIRLLGKSDSGHV